MTERVLILGLPGSGTSAVADILFRAGYSTCPPTFAKGRYPYPTHESLLGRAINRIALGSTVDWPGYRWHDDFEPRYTGTDSELDTLLRYFVRLQDQESDFWFLKNPECLLFWPLWSRVEWSRVVGVYRHPEEAVRNLHSTQKACYRREVWKRYSSVLAGVSSFLLRFPEDIESFSITQGVVSTLKPGLPRQVVDYDPHTEDWCRDVWRLLEAKRWTATLETARQEAASG